MLSSSVVTYTERVLILSNNNLDTRSDWAEGKSVALTENRIA